MILSVAFIICDILSVTNVFSGAGLPDGLNPFWKLAFVFKCLTDTIVLDDFKTALDRLKQYKLEQMGAIWTSGPQMLDRRPSDWHSSRKNLVPLSPRSPTNNNNNNNNDNNWGPDVELLNFCTVPEAVYINTRGARKNS